MALSTIPRTFKHLSIPDPSWLQIAAKHQSIERLADELYSLPIDEFRKVPYRPPPLPANAPVLGRDIIVEHTKIATRGGTRIGLRIYRPTDHGSNHLLVFNIHGGGWTVGDPETEEAQNRLISANNKAVVVSVDYRKAPEYPFPYALHDAYDAFHWSKENSRSLGTDPEKIVIVGGSAGANIAAVLAQMMRDEGTTGIIGQILNIPVTCHPDQFPLSKHEYHSFEQNAGAPIVSAARMRMFWENYLPTANSTSLASPLLAKSFVDLPPALVQVAGMDPLRDEGLAYAQELRSGGVETVLKVYGGLPHAFYIYPELPQSARYFQSMVDWIDQLLAKARSDTLARQETGD